MVFFMHTPSYPVLLAVLSVFTLTSGILFFLLWNGDQVVDSPSKRDSPSQSSRSTSGPSPIKPPKLSKDLSSPKVSSLKKSEQEMESLGFSDRIKTLPPEEVESRFRNARNVWAADPGLTAEERDRRIREFGKMLWGTEGKIPEETEEDRQAQERIRQELLEFKESVELLREDENLDRKEGQAEIHRLLTEFLAAISNDNQ
jgi:hypothetical protein